ncbi:hypothetical protein C8046_04540 [Serinibacter arcticus]|uniref:YbjN domain-containing protein n=1 Tax=Serinibacter arcticus TaxID=1655435 RepID=A0A2U1ZST8_9MICO|nr:hypothetical protein C8046_04540 [Serinibacter arcticus]
MRAGRDRVSVVTPELLREVVSERGELVRELPQGVAGHVEGHAYQVLVEGTDLVVRTRWARLLPPPARRGAAQLVNDWNRDRILPTLHIEDTEEGLAVVAVSATSIAVGLSADQVAEAVDVALTVTAHALRSLAASVPRAERGRTVGRAVGPSADAERRQTQRDGDRGRARTARRRHAARVAAVAPVLPRLP